MRSLHSGYHTSNMPFRLRREVRQTPFLQTRAHQGSSDVPETLFYTVHIHGTQTSPEAAGVRGAEDERHAQEPVGNARCLHVLQQELKSSVCLDCRAETIKTAHALPGGPHGRGLGIGEPQRLTAPLVVLLEVIDSDPPSYAQQSLNAACIMLCSDSALHQPG